MVLRGKERGLLAQLPWKSKMKEKAQTPSWSFCPLLSLQSSLLLNCTRNGTPSALEGVQQLSPPPVGSFFLAQQSQHSSDPGTSMASCNTPLQTELRRTMGIVGAAHGPPRKPWKPEGSLGLGCRRGWGNAVYQALL